MEKEKLRWEKDFAHNWNILKNVNTTNVNVTMDSESRHIVSGRKEVSILNEHMSNSAGISTALDDFKINEDEITNKIKLTNNLSYNLNFFRNLILVIDLSEYMNLNDYRPNRQKFLYKKLEYLINNFFKYNHVSTITIVTIKNHLASITSTYSNDPAQIINNLLKEQEAEGFPSIFNALNVCLEYIAILDKLNTDIVFFYASPFSFDRVNVYELLEYFVENKIEIHFFTFDTPFELQYMITQNTEGVLFKSRSSNDIYTFMNYIIYKRSIKVRNVYKLQYPELKSRSDYDILCNCHNKLCNSYYSCKDCLTIYCKLPIACKNCSSLLINELFLYQIVHNKPGQEHDQTEAIMKSFMSLQNIFNTFFHDKFLIEKKDLKKFNLEDFYTFCNLYLEHAKTLNIKELTKIASFQLENIEFKKENVFLYFKLMILYMKYLKGNCTNLNIDKCLIYNKNIDEFLHKTYTFFIKDTISCTGCDSILEKSKLKCLQHFSKLFICVGCYEIYCINCVEYLTSNQLECLECSD